MQESTTSLWPRGLLVGALLAVFLIVPTFVVMMFDSAAGTSRFAAEGSARFAVFQRPLQLRGNSAFFDGRVAVQATLLQRFAPLPPSEAVKPTGERHDLLASGPSTESARSTLLRLRLENRSDQNIEIEIVRVDSGLGAFTGQPDRLMLAPNQIASIDSPVPGQKINAHSVPVDVALRLAGTVENRKLILNEHALAQAAH